MNIKIAVFAEMGDARHGINMPEDISTVIIAQQLPGLCAAAAAGGSLRPPISHTCKNMQIESIRHLKNKKSFFCFLSSHLEEKTTDCETSFRRFLVNMLILEGIAISVLLFTHSVFLMNELDIAYAHQLIAMHCAKNIE